MLLTDLFYSDIEASPPQTTTTTVINSINSSAPTRSNTDSSTATQLSGTIVGVLPLSGEENGSPLLLRRCGDRIGHDGHCGSHFWHCRSTYALRQLRMGLLSFLLCSASSLAGSSLKRAGKLEKEGIGSDMWTLFRQPFCDSEESSTIIKLCPQ